MKYQTKKQLKKKILLLESQLRLLQIFSAFEKTFDKIKPNPPSLEEKMDKFDRDFQRHMNMKKASRKIDETRW